MAASKKQPANGKKTSATTTSRKPATKATVYRKTVQIKKPTAIDEDQDGDESDIQGQSKEAVVSRGRSTRQKAPIQPVREVTESVEDYSDVEEYEEGDPDEVTEDEEDDDDFQPAPPAQAEKQPAPIKSGSKPDLPAKPKSKSTTNRLPSRPTSKPQKPLAAPEPLKRGTKRPIQQARSESDEEEEQQEARTKARRGGQTLAFADKQPDDEQGQDDEGEDEEQEEEEEEEVRESPREKNSGLTVMQQKMIENTNKQQAKRRKEGKRVLDKAQEEAAQQMELTLQGEEGKSIGWNTLMEETGSALQTIGVMLEELEKQQEEDVLGRMLDEDLEACNNAIEPMIEQLKQHVNGPLAEQAEAVIQTRQTMEKLPRLLEKAQKRAVKHTKQKMREQYQIAQRNLTAKNYIKSVAKVMGVDLTPFRD